MSTQGSIREGVLHELHTAQKIFSKKNSNSHIGLNYFQFF